MDVYNIYMGDCMSYTSMRNPVYRDYEKYPYGTLETTFKTTTTTATQNYSHQSPGKHHHKEIKLNGKTKKEPCPFCKEQKKRPLGVYMRKRENKKHSESICEEDDENIETEEQERCPEKK